MSKPGTKIGRWYRTTRWAKKARRQITEHPLCAMCLQDGIVAPARVADHVIPHRGSEYLFWHGDLRSLCYEHHNSTKKQQEQKGWYDDIGADGFPVDENHPFNRQK